jgi:hypothetical protein
MIASSGENVQSPPPCHQNSRSLRPAPSRGSARGHFRRCPGDFRGRLLGHGGSPAGLVADFYPRHRYPLAGQVVRGGCHAVLRVCPGTLPAVSGRLPRKTPGPRWPTRRTRRRLLCSPAARSCAVAAALGVQPLETRRGSVLPIGHRLGSAGASAGWRTAQVQRQPSSSRTSVGAATVAMIANRTVAKTAAANKMATPFIKAPCIPRQEYLPLPCCRMEVRPALLESTGNFGTVADP